MAKIGEIIKTEPAFPDAEQTKAEELVGKKLKLLGFAHRTGMQGEFLVVLVKVGNKLVSFSNGGKVIMDKLGRLARHYKVEKDSSDVVRLPEEVEATLTYVKGKKSGMSYYDLAE